MLVSHFPRIVCVCVSGDLKEVRTRGLSAISVPSRGTVSVKATVAGQAGQEKER